MDTGRTSKLPPHLWATYLTLKSESKDPVENKGFSPIQALFQGIVTFPFRDFSFRVF